MNKKTQIDHYARAANDIRDAVIYLSRIGDTRAKTFVRRLRPILRNERGTGLDDVIATMLKEVEE